MHNSIYLLQEREFINSNENIYKIGRTKQANIQRFNQYPKGSKLLLHIVCDDCDILETELIRDFKNKYIHRKDIGNEYFEGDYKEMIKDIYNKIPNLNVETGQQLVDSINNVLSDNYTTLNNLQSENSLLPKEIIYYNKNKLPESPTGGRVNLLNVIGCASGYLIEELNKVNQAIDQLNKTPYGKQIHAALENVTLAFNEYRQNYFLLSEDGVNTNWPNQLPVVLQKYKINFDSAVNVYYNLLSQITSDPTTRTLAQQINGNWDRLCENISYEVRNFNKANLNIAPFDDNTAIYSFISTINSYSNDSQGLGIDYLLYGLAQPNESGDLVKAILNQFKNNNNLAQTGVNVNGLV